MKPRINLAEKSLLASLLCGMLLLAAGCDDKDFKHDPPAGQGSIIVDNCSSDVIHAYIGGVYTNDVGRYEYEAYDRAPGVYRVLLDQKSGERSYSRDIDVIEGKLTILKVNVDEGKWEYNVKIYYEN